MLHDKCQNGVDFGLDVLDYLNDSLLTIEQNTIEEEGDMARSPSKGHSNTPHDRVVESTLRGTTRDGDTPERLITDGNEKPFFMDSSPQEPQPNFSKQDAQITELTPSSFIVPDAPDANSHIELGMSYTQMWKVHVRRRAI